jgi:fibronectin type 3 domain-containing protein
MKTITLSALLLVATISLSSFVISNNETNAIVSTSKGPGILRVHKQGPNVSLTWSDDAHAASFKVQRGDGDYFETLTTVENTGARSNNFKDVDVFPGTYYYRIVCVDADENELCTHTDVIKITKHG